MIEPIDQRSTIEMETQRSYLGLRPAYELTIRAAGDSLKDALIDAMHLIEQQLHSTDHIPDGEGAA